MVYLACTSGHRPSLRELRMETPAGILKAGLLIIPQSIWRTLLAACSASLLIRSRPMSSGGLFPK